MGATEAHYCELAVEAEVEGQRVLNERAFVLLSEVTAAEDQLQ